MILFQMVSLMIDISRPELAEAIFNFTLSDEVYLDFANKRSETIGSLSMAEYVAMYRLQDFESWLRSCACAAPSGGSKVELEPEDFKGGLDENFPF